ncbi:E3 SUMO- ligase NSE2 [Pelobates cultripes]|uniref:E3 SUMO-protein ligase NSE2 n=2 Tax=Pelobates cultripes TaxID=61616 RepID=A0AAD1W2G4_PELCU|nr:E3 SUMO- ligase NSE2 [Pelobates cultripes]
MQGCTAPLISFTPVDNSLSSLKNCQAYINTGMEIATNVALDLLETGCDADDVESMEPVMLEYAAMDRDLNQYIHAAEEIVRKLKRDPPERVPDLLALVKERYSELQSKNAQADLKKNDRFIQFKEQLREMRRQMGVSQDETTEETFEDVDEDIAVTQSQLNLICPITQVQMTNPVKNKVCGHTYQKDAIENMIQNSQLKKKKTRCPKIGCDHADIKIADLIPDIALKRAIDIQNKQKK